MAHRDYTRTPTPVVGVPSEVQREATAPITPQTPVTLSLRNFLGAAVLFAAIIGGAYTSYNALAATDKDLAAKHADLAEKLKGTATKADLRDLRLDMRYDLNQAEFSCVRVGRDGVKCGMILPPLRGGRQK
jgi:hypothetical protein